MSELTKQQRNQLGLALSILGRSGRSYTERAAVLHGISLSAAWSESHSDDLREVIDLSKSLRRQELTEKI